MVKGCDIRDLVTQPLTILVYFLDSRVQTHDSAGHGVCGDGVEEFAAPAAWRVIDAVNLDVALGAGELKKKRGMAL